MSAKTSTRLLVPALRPALREILVPVAPFFLRDLTQAPLARPPLILSFATDGFMDDFLAVAGQTRSLPRLLPWRDWSEPPDAMLDTVGAPRYPNSIARGPLLAFDPESGGGIDPDGVPGGTPPWLRKLYLPLHERFNLIAFDVVCRSPGWPRLARPRVMASGAVIRRLARHPTEEHWQDWIAVDDQHGAWIELLDGQMRPPDPPAASAEHQPVDPAALPVADLRASAQAALHGLLNIPAGQALPPVALTSQALALVPPDTGQAAEHCTLFGYLPVFSSAQEVVTARLSQRTVAAIAATLAAQSRTTLNDLFAAAPALRARAASELRTLLVDALLPTRPTAGEITNARTLINNPGHLGFSAPLDIHNAVATGVDWVLRRAIAALWTGVSAAATANLDIAGQVPTGQHLWQSSGASGQATAPDVFSAMSDEAPGESGAQPAEWLRQNCIQHTLNWDRLVRERLHQVIDHWLNTGVIPPPIQGNSSVLGAADLSALLLLAVLRLRGHRLALAAYLSPLVGLGDAGGRLRALDADGHPIATAAALGEEVESILTLEAGRADPRTAPPWALISYHALPNAGRLLGVHRAGAALADLYAALDAGLGAAGGVVGAEMRARAATLAGEITGVFRIAGGVVPLRAAGASLFEQPAQGLLVLPGFPSVAATLAQFADQAANRFVLAPESLALPEARARETAPRLRFDADRLYAVWCWVRVAGRHPCEPEQIIWTGRSEPFAIADPTDLLGGRPAVIKLPDIPKLLRDLPRLAKARARPFAAVVSPDRSGLVTGEEMADTQRDWGIGFICSFGIPVLTICAMVLFSLIFSILILIPGFTWMLLLKFCIPFPKKGS